jgi:hypothetical protein
MEVGMKIPKYDRHGIFLLSALTILFVVGSIGCSKSNDSSIVGNWNGKSINSMDGSGQNIIIKFNDKGDVSKITENIISDELSRTNKINGKYRIEGNRSRISITWDDGKSEVLELSFPKENKMLLGRTELEKIKQ